MTLSLRLFVASSLFVVLSGVAIAPSMGQEGDERSDNVELVGSVDLAGATDVEFTKDGYAVMTVNGSGQYAGLWVIDVRDPSDPKPVGHLPCAGSGYDVGLWRNVAVMSSDSAAQNSSTEGGCNADGTNGQEGIRLVDISNRAEPREI